MGILFKFKERNVPVSYVLQRVIKHKVVLSVIKITSKETCVSYLIPGAFKS